MLRRTAVVGALLLSGSALACDLTGLEHPLVFSPGESALSTTEILKLAEWDSQLKDDFRNGGKYRVRLQEASEPAPDPELAVLRLRSLQAVLDAVGIEGDKVESSEADTHLRAVEREGVAPKVPAAAYVVFQPDCQNPCCAGAAPAPPLAPQR
ncbi:hypothetical protein R20233_04964 [Ralstonia sp. LMG 32965]|uniref:hypothetical protein n=1 Tax=Ralstonia flatus TaxID=3058601 RepID=UPI0028F53F4C|nr:hypothetical protein [Ralstonia sp. LMG 32965]CAJ0903559.1 hypothetical protein R20233_04964 [Ralstonia sp. LMG 32965]